MAERRAITGECRTALIAFALVAVAGADGIDVAAADPPEQSAANGEQPVPSLSAEARQIADELDRSLPTGSEARAMYDDILAGRMLGPNDGWFRLALAQTRFGWDAVRQRHDRNGDDAISSDEFSGSKEDFARLDRDGDGKVTQPDLSWPGTAQERDGAMALFRMADQDVDGRATREDFAKLFDRLDADGEGFVTLDDLRAAFHRASAGGRGGEGPSVETLLRGLALQEVGSLQAGPSLDEAAPDFTLETVDGSQRITLSEQIGDKPVVLVFGNFTCGPFRAQSGNVEKLYRRFRDRATFLMVYVREAHPTDGWHMESNTRVGVSVDQPKTYAERVAVAARCQQHIDFGMSFLVDTIDDRVGATYSGMPSRLYVIDREGRVAYKSGRGPFGFKPAEMEQSLIFLLAETPPAAAVSTP